MPVCYHGLYNILHIFILRTNHMFMRAIPWLLALHFQGFGHTVNAKIYTSLIILSAVTALTLLLLPHCSPKLL